MVSRAGLEPGDHSEPSQVIDFNKLQKRQNRYFRRFEVHGGYAEQQRTAQKNASNQGRRPLTGITPGRPFLLISETNCKAGLLPSRSSQRSWRRPASFKLALGGRARARCGRSLVRRKLHGGYKGREKKKAPSQAAPFLFPIGELRMCTTETLGRESSRRSSRGRSPPYILFSSLRSFDPQDFLFAATKRRQKRGRGTPSTVSTSTRFGKYLSWPVCMGRSYATTRRFDSWRN